MGRSPLSPAKYLRLSQQRRTTTPDFSPSASTIPYRANTQTRYCRTQLATGGYSRVGETFDRQNSRKSLMTILGNTEFDLRNWEIQSLIFEFWQFYYSPKFLVRKKLAISYRTTTLGFVNSQIFRQVTEEAYKFDVIYDYLSLHQREAL